MKIGGNACTIINAANEIAVHSFLQNKIQFLDIAKFIEIALNKINIIPNPSLDDVINTDLETRNFTEKLIN
jgi:1-deoxy-D-xylulose-5-phosphate reductoisomerase